MDPLLSMMKIRSGKASQASRSSRVMPGGAWRVRAKSSRSAGSGARRSCSVGADLGADAVVLQLAVNSPSRGARSVQL